MKLYFYRGETTNFGDELNEWLMPKVFPGLFDDEDNTLFLGIGSVLFDHHPPEKLKIVFGSGYGGYTALPTIDDRWAIYCLRGPRTADALGLGRDLVAGDSAILINRFVETPGPALAFGASFMPHFQSVGRGHWQAACRLAGINFIDPREPVVDIIRDIRASKLMITEAMHGAIVADALRVPWLPILPFDKTHHFKWHDWAEALEVELRPNRLAPSSIHEALVAWRGREIIRLATASKSTKATLNLFDGPFIAAAAIALSQIAKKAPCLSSDNAFGRTIARLEESADRIKRDFQKA